MTMAARGCSPERISVDRPEHGRAEMLMMHGAPFGLARD